MNAIFQEVLEYARGMWRRRMIGLVVAWVVAVAGLVALAVAPDQYRASARVFVDTQSVLKPLMSGLAVQPNVDQQVRMLSRTLLSRPNIEKLVRMADLDLDIKETEQREALLERVTRSISLSGGGDNLYSISFVDKNPAKAKRVVDSLLSLFVEGGLGGNRRDTQKAQQFIEQQIQEYERKLQESERRLKDFKLKNLEQVGAGNAVEAIGALEAQLGSARIELRAAMQSRDALKRELAGESPTLMSVEGPSSPGGAIGGVSVPEYDGRITGLRGKLDEMMRIYTDQHPDVIGTKRLLGELEKERDALAEERRKAMVSTPGGTSRVPAQDRNPVYQQLKVALADAEASAAALKGRTDELQRRIEEVRSRARMRPEIEEELTQLNRDYGIHKSNYDSLLSRRESAMMTGQLEQTASVADFRIIDPPRVGNKPVAPNRLLMLAAVVGVSLGAGAFATLAYSQLFPVFHSLKSLRKSIPRPVLGALSFQESPVSQRRSRLLNILFFSGVGSLLTAFAGALLFLLFVLRVA